jgi:ribosomal protein S18 acetylase RimI-like enzyme
MPLDLPQRLIARDGCTLTVRRLTRDDVVALQRFNEELSGDSRGRFLPHSYDDLTMGKVLTRSEAGKDLVLGAFDGERMAAYFFLWYFTERVPLLGIGMLDEYQGRGFGGQLMLALVAAAKANGNEGIELTTMQDNHRAFALYEQVGFEYYGNVENIDGDGRVIIERGMFYEIKPGAMRYDGKHAPPV